MSDRINMTGDGPSAQQPGGRVLATLNADGSRFWIKPRLSTGRFWHRRRAAAYLLIALFTLIPYVTINGHPAMLFNLAERRFHLFGWTFLPTDTVLMALLMISIFLTIFFVTALFGRVWCGWACPQTVYMEYLYRPIERLIEGAPGSRRAAAGVSAPMRALKYIVFFVCSCYLAHTFLAYFVGVEQLRHWIFSSPMDHPAAFLVMAVTTGLMMFDFAFFREQTCLVACPYGRIQAAMLDRNSLIITYDDKRGEPRGKMRKKAPEALALPVISEPSNGDCVDCKMCVTTCPTGIDIRNGLQMECIGCAQCIDACDSVMDKIGKPRGLIRYSSQAILNGERRHIIRPRIFLYPLLLAGFFGMFVYLLATKPPAEAAILPRQGLPFYAMPDGRIANQVRLRLVNRSAKSEAFRIGLPVEALQAGAKIIMEQDVTNVQPAESASIGFVITAPPEVFSGRGAFETSIVVSDDAGFCKSLDFRMLGPARGREAPASAAREESR